MKGTRELIVAEAFLLFAARGYHAVSVRDIAAEVGIKDASLYNHFSSKQAIFDAVIDGVVERMCIVFESQGVLFSPEDDPAGYAVTREETERRVLAGFQPFFEDEDLVRLRRLLTVSQFDDERAAAAYRFVFIERPLSLQASVFEHLMAIGQFVRDDAAVLAREFYGPVLLLLVAGVSWQEAQPPIRENLKRFMAAHSAAGNNASRDER